MDRFNIKALAWALWLATSAAQSAPMGFKDSWMAMGDLGPNWKELFANYALTPRDALGASGLVMRSDDKRRTRDVAEVFYTRLVQRWNLPDAQANIWFIGGVGGISGNNFGGTKALVSPGVQLDFETTRLYASLNARLYRAGGVRHDYSAARLGFSFFEADYDETQPWLVVEVRRMVGLSSQLEVTPMFRFIHNRYFIEVGINQSRQARANFMVIF